MSEITSDRTETLLRQATAGDPQATAKLLERHRSRLRRMIGYRMDSRLVQRFDPSDVVQEAMLAASVKMPEYLQERPVSFYPWLRRIAWERLVDLQRQHLGAQRRSVAREEPPPSEFSDDSLNELADSIVPQPSSPLTVLVREERLSHLREALLRLDEQQREVLVLRYLEGLSLQEVAEVMGTSVASTKMRHMRAIRRLRELLQSP